MGQNVGEIDLDLVLQSQAFKKQLSNEVNSAMKSVGKSAGGLSGTFSALGKVIAAAFAVKQVVAFGKECLKLGSDLAEVQNVVDVTFGSMSGEIDDFAKKAMDAYGLSETVAKKYAGTFGAMSKSFGFAGKDAVAMSETLTGLSADVASFYNMSTDEAYTKIKSVFTGETESLKELGVVMTQNALDQFAMQKGYGKTTAKMTEQEKVALRYAFVLDKLSAASGDFQRTSDGWANQTRVLALRFDALKASIGQGLINVLTPVVKWLNIILAKLQVVADAFAKFTAMIMGKKSDTAKGTAAIASDLGMAATGAEDTAAGISDAGTAAKKAAKTLMAIDELNTLQANDDSGSGGSGGSGGGFDMPDLGGEESAVDEINGKLSEMQKFLNQLKGEFLDGFKLGYKDADFQKVIDSLTHIGQMVKDIFTDPEVVNAAKNWALTVSNALGKITGSIARTAVNIAQTLVGGVEKYLEQHSGDVKQFIVDMFNISAETAQIAGDLSIAMADIWGHVFGTEASQQLVADIINIFATANGTVIELTAKLTRDVLGAIAKPIIDNKEAIGEALGNLVEFFGSIVNTISQGFTNTAKTIQTVYDTYVAPMFTALGNGFSEIVGAIFEGFNTYIKPVLDEWGTRFSALWTEHIQPCIDSILVAVGKVCQLIGILWEKYLAPFVAWFIKNIYPVIAPILQFVGDTVMILFGIICDVITGVMKVLQGILDFLIGVFSLDWGTAWQGVQEIFSGVWTAISGVVTGAWEYIKNTISLAVEYVKSVIMFWLTAIQTAFTTVWNAIKAVVTSIITAIATAISTKLTAIQAAASATLNGVKATFTNIWNGIKSTVTGIVNGISTGITSALRTMSSTISGILNGIKGFFTSVFSAIVSTVTNAINGIVGGVNSAISAINKLTSVNIAGHSFGLNIPTIPKLATGGFVEANSPQLAMIGDNKREGEIVAPESKISEAVANGMASVMNQLGAMMGGNSDGTPINIYLGNELLDSMIVNSQNRRALRSGGRG